MSWQTKVWGTFAPSERQRVLEFKFQALDIESLRSKLRSEATTVAHYGQILRESGAEFLELWYEDFFDLALKASDRAEFYNRLVVFLGGSAISDWGILARVQELFDPHNTRLNSAVTYALIPNARDIERQLGTDKTGWLFRDTA